MAIFHQPGDESLLAAALAYAERGWHVLAVHSACDGACTCGNAHCRAPGKHPRTHRGLLDAATDAAQIRRWWARWPTANVGIACEPSGLAVLDVDFRNGGDDTFKNLCNSMPALAALGAPLVQTGNGFHAYFRAPGSVRVVSNAGRLGPGIDMRAAGGYVVAPPSRHVTGASYVWMENCPQEPPPLPEELLALLRGPAPAPSSALPCIPPGRRNNAAFSVACTMARQGLNVNAIAEGLRSLRDSGVLVVTDEAPFGDPEIERVAASAARAIERAPVEPVRTVLLIPASTIRPTEPRFLLYPYIPRGELTWFEGATKSGKTFAAIDIIARMTRGEAFATGARIEQGRVAILTCEDAPAHTIIPRLIAAGACMDMVKIIRVEDAGEETPPTFEHDLDGIKRGLYEDGTGLLFVDGTFGFLDVQDSNSYRESYRAMLPLVAMLRELGIGAIAVRHIRKSDGSALNRGIGSVGFASLARSTISIAVDRDDETGARRLFAHAGSNLAEIGPTLAFTIEGVEIEGFERSVGRTVWGSIVNATADEVMAERDGEDRSALDAACDFLQDQLLAGPRLSLDTYAAATRARISRATLRRAQKRLGVTRTRVGAQGPWQMILPEEVHAQDLGTSSHLNDESVPVSVSTYPEGSSPLGAPGERAASEDAPRGRIRKTVVRE